ncbi:hypothetical protein HN51_071514 [Arachis hypogaea]|uniref:embryo-specific protein ATS3B n=1 Tax=Arachis hypogaea TaxID=3818 RepID=UPI000DED01DE|nr:embryo-specific protein ATS3B [Arachis hypogaea]QHO14126.1 uncharacterized protein DS421_15g521480 [Arachis hypogaea]
MNMKEVVVVPRLVLFLFFAFGLALSVSESKTIPHAADDSFSVGYIQMRSAKNCSYLVTINTSCSSPKFTTDQISIVFGDAHGNQVFAPRLDGYPISETFGQCASDTFHREGPCTQNICFAYLRRCGSNFKGWMPQTVQIYSQHLEHHVTFNFNTFIPNDTWYGYNFCQTPPPPPSPPPHPVPPHDDSPPPPPSPPPHPPHHDEPPPPPPPPHYHSPPPPSPSPPPPSHPPPPPPSPSPPPPSPPPPPPSLPPPPPPSSSNHLSNQNWIIYLVVGLVLSIIWM